MDLLRAAEPYQAPAGRKQRVRLSLGQVAAARAGCCCAPLVAALVLIEPGRDRQRGAGSRAAALGCARGRAGWSRRASGRPGRSCARGAAARHGGARRPRGVTVKPPAAAPPARGAGRAGGFSAARRPAARVAEPAAAPRPARRACVDGRRRKRLCCWRRCAPYDAQGDPARARVLLGRYLAAAPERRAGRGGAGDVDRGRRRRSRR